MNSALIESDEEEEEEDYEDLSYISRSTGYIRQVRKTERKRRFSSDLLFRCKTYNETLSMHTSNVQAQKSEHLNSYF